MLLKIEINNYFNKIKNKLNENAKRMRDPRRKIEDSSLKIDDLASRLNRILCDRIHLERKNHQLWDDRLHANNPVYTFLNIKQKLDYTKNNLKKIFEIYIRFNKIKIREITEKLQALSPVAILKRGYSITRTLPGKTVVRDPETVYLDQNLEIMVALGRLYCRVKGKTPHG